ncbi:MAG TPA: hypothetical protein V6C72_00845 [Chroococcales cyanobacterium]
MGSFSKRLAITTACLVWAPLAALGQSFPPTTGFPQQDNGPFMMQGMNGTKKKHRHKGKGGNKMRFDANHDGMLDASERANLQAWKAQKKAAKAAGQGTGKHRHHHKKKNRFGVPNQGGVPGMPGTGLPPQ